MNVPAAKKQPAVASPPVRTAGAEAAAAGLPPGRIRIGISGWRYAPWRGVFYPEGLPQRRELAFAAEHLTSIEVNGTFYALQRPASFAQWAAETPDDFVFAIKGSRYITHRLRLKEAATPLANFFASGLLSLGRKLGPLLWQLPPYSRFDPERLAAFFALLPRDGEAAVRLARRHDARMAGRAAIEADGIGAIRHALEIRHASFVTPAFIELLREHDVALVCADSNVWPRLMDLTADFVYCRLHGPEALYASGYDDAALDAWAARAAAWARGGEPADAERVIDAPAPATGPKPVFVYFDNDVKARAPFDAQALIARVDRLLAETG